ncbi:MAG: nucleotide sugar dehydrogenase [Lentisphaeria bacterium]
MAQDETMINLVVVGGCGHVGLPLGLAFASKGVHVTLLDINEQAIADLNQGVIPFQEEGAQEILYRHLNKNLFVCSDDSVVDNADVVCFITGTPIDEHLNPRVQDVIRILRHYKKHLHSHQLIILRSTIYPGTTRVIENILQNESKVKKLAFCPERIQEGKGISEIFSLPQLVSATSLEAEQETIALFSRITEKIIVLSPEEAELAKLMTNSWRYLQFAIANQFYMMATEFGYDFHKIFAAMTEDYPRARSFARPGLAAGPCLFKDTMQIAAFHKHHFHLGHSAMLVNEGLPSFLVDQMSQKFDGDLRQRKIAILGMTFKADNDDTRESLSFKIKKILEFRMAEVIPSDPWLPETCPLEEALAQADGIILGVPHKEYLTLSPQQPFVDCWGIWSNPQKS